MKNQRVVVLGGTQGIGLAVAHRVVADGGEVVVSSSTQANVDSAVRELGAAARGIVADLRSAKAIDKLVAEVSAFDHLVYTAGENLLLSPLKDLDFEKARAFFEVRYWGALAAVKAAAPRLRSGGSIVLTGGAAGTRPHPGFVVGSSICGAVESLTRTLALELAPIRVNIVIPGFVDTPLWANIPSDARTAMFRDAAAKLPVKRIGTADDIAEHYLGFMRGQYVTGQSIIVDGGGVLV